MHSDKRGVISVWTEMTPPVEGRRRNVAECDLYGVTVMVPSMPGWIKQ
jgi:hypothetical protein